MYGDDGKRERRGARISNQSRIFYCYYFRDVFFVVECLIVPENCLRIFQIF